MVLARRYRFVFHFIERVVWLSDEGGYEMLLLPLAERCLRCVLARLCFSEENTISL